MISTKFFYNLKVITTVHYANFFLLCIGCLYVQHYCDQLVKLWLFFLDIPTDALELMDG